MGLSSELVSQFAKVVNGDDKSSKESTICGTVVEYGGSTYVNLDGSDLLTPVTTTTNAKTGDRVMVLIKNHTAIITGNVSSPAARTADVEEVSDDLSAFITEMGTVVAYNVSTEELSAMVAAIDSLRAKFASTDEFEALHAEIDELEAQVAELDSVTATDVDAVNATIDNLEAILGEFTDISTDTLDAAYADITNLRGYTADFTYVSADRLSALNASIKELDATKLSVEAADIKYANIDFSNISEATMQSFYANSGLIENVTISEGVITGQLVGVTITGDLIEGNTVKADKLVVKGSDGLYYKLNFEAGTFADGEAVPEDSLHGSVITAKSIVAEKISVDDLVAFDATIGGFQITSDAIYSGVKTSVDNTTRGIYMDNTGQFAIGDADNFLKYYKDSDGSYNLVISASSIILSSTSQTLESVVSATLKDIIIEYAVSSSPTDPPEGVYGTRQLGTPVIRLTAEQLNTPVIYLEADGVEDGQLGTPEIYIESSSSSTTAVLGQAVLGQMILGNDSEESEETVASYSLSQVYTTSESSEETEVWSTTMPEWVDGQYIWQRITYIYADGSKIISDPVCISGATGPQGEAGTNGSDAISYRIESSLGTVFLDTQNDTTVLTARIYKGSSELDSNGAYGYSWYLVESDGTEQCIGTGKTLSVLTSTIAGKGVYFIADDGGNTDDITWLDAPIIYIKEE